MTRDQIDHVFDKFYRADTSDTAVGGLGVGMSLARSIIEAHGGRIWVESEPMRGTTVCFIIPPREQRGKGDGGDYREKEDPLRGEEGVH